jgi:hypothetical protein
MLLVQLRIAVPRALSHSGLDPGGVGIPSARFWARFLPRALSHSGLDPGGVSILSARFWARFAPGLKSLGSGPGQRQGFPRRGFPGAGLLAWALRSGPGGRRTPSGSNRARTRPRPSGAGFWTRAVRIPAAWFWARFSPGSGLDPGRTPRRRFRAPLYLCPSGLKVARVWTRAA